MTLVLFLSLVLGTLVSEDLTTITAGVLIQRGEIGALPGVLACATGIFLGDSGLWLIGRLSGTAALAWPWTARHLESRRADGLRRWLDDRAGAAILTSRFLPGTRLPLYVLAGVMRMPYARFARWTLVGAVLWAPLLVLLTAEFDAALAPTGAVHPGVRLLYSLAATAAVLALLHAARTLTDASRRMRLAVTLQRWARWEFWPMWLFYAPVAAWIGWLSLRYGGLTTVTAANPGIPDGGTVGESKFDILATLPTDAVVPSILISPGDASRRVRDVERHMQAAGWTFPLVAKPDVGQRGAGVKLARDAGELCRYFSVVRERVVVQPYHEGPFEAGVFYYRLPGEARGRILSVTDKEFPAVVGDGVSTVETLIWRHPRYRLQAGTFSARHGGRLQRVLAAGERFQLGIAGNHAQGAIFQDGAHLITPALERRIDEIARAVTGFFVGRFDIRYRDRDAFTEGRDLAIVELNGATAESTNIYDPRTRLVDAYRQLFSQWAIVFAIGAANRRAGAPVSSLRRLAALVRTHLTAKMAFEVSD